jgi:hypothetical protein
VKLGKNADDTCALLSEAYGAEAMKKCEVFFSGIHDSKRVARTWKMMKEVVVQDFTEPVKMLKKCGIWCTKALKYQPSLLCGETEAVT